MRLAPRYDGPPILSIDDEPMAQLVPTTRQRERFARSLTDLAADQWAHPSRCAGWTVRDVVAHLVTVNTFWNASIIAGRAGAPTRVLVGFDPAATPPKLVDTMRAQSAADVLAQFVASNDALLATMRTLTADEWSMPAESPVGHVPIRLVAQHALWDSWVHERDVMLPLALDTTHEADELSSCLQYAAAVGPLMGLGIGRTPRGTFGIEATKPTVRFVVDVGDVVWLHAGRADTAVPLLRGDTVDLIEVLSLRSSVPADAPPEWTAMLAGLRAAFDPADAAGPHS